MPRNTNPNQRLQAPVDEFGRQAVSWRFYDTVTIGPAGLGAVLPGQYANLPVFTGDNVGKPNLTNQATKTGIMQQDEEMAMVGIGVSLKPYASLEDDIVAPFNAFNGLADMANVLANCAMSFQIGSTPYGPFKLAHFGNAGGLWGALATGVTDLTAASLHALSASIAQNGTPSPMGYWRFGHYILTPGNQPITVSLLGNTGALLGPGVAVEVTLIAEPYFRNVRPETGLRVRRS